MVFPWHVPYANPELTKHAKDRAVTVLRDEIKARARILHRLGYPEADVVKRLGSYTEWDFELTGSSPIKSEIPKIVKEVFGSK